MTTCCKGEALQHESTRFHRVFSYQSTFSLRFGLTTSNVIGAWTDIVELFRFSSLSSCSLDFFFLFLSLASPRPLGMLPSRPVEASGPAEHNAHILVGVPEKRRTSARVTTRTGDRGETSLFGTARVRKTDARIEALGDLDEAQAAIGIARSLAGTSSVRTVLLEVQRGLYNAMSEVATPAEDRRRLAEPLDDAAVKALDDAIERVKKASPVEGRFVIPGEDPLSAALDLARTVTRRAERRVVACVDAGLVDADVLLPWMNRLSDLLYLLARASERRAAPARATKGTRKRT